MKILLRAVVIALIVAAVMQATRCAMEPPNAAAETVAVADLVRRPANYEGRKVTIRAKVVDRMSILGAGAYLVSAPEGADTIAVLGLATAPAIGEIGSFTGTFRMAATFGSYQAAVLIVH